MTLALAFMLAGSALPLAGPSYDWLVAGRIVGGVGGVIVNVVMTKMLVDWFAGREISTALAVFVNSWPLGIALALFILPGTANAGGLTLAWIAVAGAIAIALVTFALVYRPAPKLRATASDTAEGASIPWTGLGLAAAIWALYNVALAMVFSFGPALLTERGWSLAGAGALTSAFMVAFSLAVPVGGTIADRTGRRDLVIGLSLASFAALIPLVTVTSGAVLSVLLVGAGALFALAAGPIMSLPSLILPLPARTFGMGAFFAFYYVVMMAGPRIAGGMAEASGRADVAVLLGAAASGLALAAFWGFRRGVRGATA